MCIAIATMCLERRMQKEHLFSQILSDALYSVVTHLYGHQNKRCAAKNHSLIAQKVLSFLVLISGQKIVSGLLRTSCLNITSFDVCFYCRICAMILVFKKSIFSGPFFQKDPVSFHNKRAAAICYKWFF